MHRLNHKIRLCTIILIFFISTALYAANFGTSTAEFLKIKSEAGPAGMGEAYTGISDNTAALTYNPAGLAMLDRIEIAGTQILWFDGINMTHIAYAHPLDNDTGFGFDVLWIDFGQFDSTGIPGNSISLQDCIASAGFAKSLGDFIDVGIDIRGLYEKLIDTVSFGASADAGVMLKILSRNITMGLAVKNIGFIAGTSDSLPMEACAGIGLRLFNGKQNYLNFDIDASKVFNTDNLFLGAGVEGTIFNVFTLRLGFKYNNALEPGSISFSDIARMTALTAGAGFTLGDYSMNFSYTPMGDLNQIMRIELKMRFGESMYERQLAGQKAVIMPKAIEAPDVKVEEGVIKSVSFKPNMPEEKVKEWSLNIKSQDGKIVKSFSGVGEVPKNLTWDGTDSSGKIAKADANYVFDFKAKDSQDRIVKTVGNIVQPEKTYLSDEGDKRFVPQKGREILVAPVTLLVSANSEERKQVPFVMVNDRIKKVKGWAFDIYDKNNAPMKKFSGEGSIPSYLVWDGRDFDGNYVDDLKSLKYVLTITGTNGKKVEIKDRQVMREPFVIASGTKILKMVKRIYFAPNSSEIMTAMEPRLQDIAAEISGGAKLQIYIQGHASAEGDRTYNVMLSQQRAKEVLRYLVERYRISPLSVTTVGYGADIPVAQNNTEETRSKNRRVEIIIMGETE